MKPFVFIIREMVLDVSMHGVQRIIDRHVFVGRMIRGDVDRDELQAMADKWLVADSRCFEGFVALFECYSELHGNENITRSYRGVYWALRLRHRKVLSDLLHIAVLAVLYAFRGWVAFLDNGGNVRFKVDVTKPTYVTGDMLARKYIRKWLKFEI